MLVVSHEFGHFIVAKKLGMRVDEFSFGFPPKLFGYKKGETQYNINLLPLGGYVKIYGENSAEDDSDDKDSKRSFKNKPLWARSLVLCAGVVMNFLLAWVLLSVGFMSGLPSSVSQAPAGYSVSDQYLTITSVVSKSPAEKSGLKIGDKILSLRTISDTTETPSADSVRYFVRNHGKENITISYLRASDSLESNVTPVSNLDGTSMIGISMDVIGKLQLPVHKALWEGLKLSSNLFISTITGFYNLIYDGVTGNGNLSTLSGPVGIVGVVGDAAKFGFIYLLSFTALISINLAVINLVPFPALDGGQLLFILIEKIKGSRINPKVANTLNMVGFGILMLLMVVITYHDIVKIIK